MPYIGGVGMDQALAYRHLYQLQQQPQLQRLDAVLIDTVYQLLAPAYALAGGVIAPEIQLKALVAALSAQYPDIDHHVAYAGVLDCRAKSSAPYSIHDILSQSVFLVHHPDTAQAEQKSDPNTCRMV